MTERLSDVEVAALINSRGRFGIMPSRTTPGGNHLPARTRLRLAFRPGEVRFAIAVVERIGGARLHPVGEYRGDVEIRAQHLIALMTIDVLTHLSPRLRAAHKKMLADLAADRRAARAMHDAALTPRIS